MQITKQQLLRAIPDLYQPRVDEFVASFNMWSIHYDFTNPKRIVHYLAQVFHESGALRYTEEIASGDKYEGRKDLGNTQKGDGKRFKGRGYIQLTGRANYQKYTDSDLCILNMIEKPELVATYPHNQMVSMWFWESNKLHEIADKDDGGMIGESIVKKITKKVNGGQNGLAQRLYYYRRFKKEFGL